MATAESSVGTHPRNRMTRSGTDLGVFCVAATATIGDAVRCIDANGEGLAIVLTDDGHLMDTVTDGDVRRALLAGAALDAPVKALLEIGKRAPHDKGPVTAPKTLSDADLLQMMTEKVIRQLPLVDEHGELVDIAFMHELVEELEEDPVAILMAGGRGARLLPLTEKVPKPLLPIGDKPVMERIISQLREAGIKKMNVAVHHKSEQISSHFGNGSRFGVELTYVAEDKPLGTAGSLRALGQLTEPFIVINADIVTTLSYKALIAYHREHKADITVAVRRYEIAVPYGVLECDGPQINRLVEKPVTTVLVNAGIYLVEPRVTKLIPEDEHFDMTDLVSRVLESGGSVVAFPIHEYWLDIGRHEDYSSAQRAFREGLLGT